MYLCFDLFFVQKKSGIEQAFAFVFCISRRAADQYTDGIRFFFDQVYRIITFIDKIIKLYKISCRVTAYTHFAEQDQVAPLCFGIPYRRNNLFCIAFEIADMIILLR